MPHPSSCNPSSAPAAEAFLWPVRVYWEDTDAGGIVFYANYLKFFERARTECLRSLGLEQQRLRQSTGGMFVVSALDMRYLRPARLDDQLLVSARTLRAGTASVTIAQNAWLGAATSGPLLATGTVRLGWVDAATLQVARMPEPVRAAFALP